MHLKRGIVSVSKGCNVSSWDGVIHWSPAAQFPGLKTRAVAVVWNPLSTAIEGAEIKLPLYYAGFAGRGVRVAVREAEGEPRSLELGANDTVTVRADLAPLGVTYFVVE
jgi:hypothetical protein|eukprot:COSAG06_NODE_413_length_16040_cov_8.901386_12_plen_109_part_00